MKLAKPRIDIGVMTNDLEPMLHFWQHDVGLPFEEVLPTGRGRRQHRHGLNGSVFKLNHSRDAIPDAPPAGYRELWIAREGIARAREGIAGARELVDPDGSRVVLLPPGERDVTGIGVRLGVRDPDAFHAFYGHALGLERAGECAYRCGDSLLCFERDTNAAKDATLQGKGYRYITIQVHDVDAEHAGILERGGAEGQAPMTLGEVARISFVRDPDGNWIEISQRRSLVGTLESSSS